MIVLRDSAGTTQAHLLTSPRKEPLLLTSGTDPVANIVTLPSSFLFTRAANGNEVEQIYRFDVASRKTTLLTDGKSRHSRPFWNAATRRIAYGRIGQSGLKTIAELHVMDPDEPSKDRTVLTLTGANWSMQDWSRSGERILVLERKDPLHSALWIIDVSSGKLTPVKETSGRIPDYTAARFAPDGRSLYVLSDRNSEFHQLGLIDIETGQHAQLTGSIQWDIDGFTISPDGKQMSLIANENGLGSLYLLDLTRPSQPRKVKGLIPGIAYGMRWHPDSRRLAFGFVSNRSTDDAYCLVTSTGKIERWSQSRAQVSLEHLPPVRLVQWKSFDGLQLSGFLYPPAKRFKGRRPVIVDIHGGPNAQARPGFITSGNYALNELGIAYLFPNVRGSTGFGRTFQALDDGVKRFDSVKDIGTLLEWIKTQPDLDPTRVMVSGLSHGGYLTLSTAATYPDRIRCAIDVAGPSSLVTFLENTAIYRRDVQRKEYGDERDPETRKVLEDISPLRNASKIRRPLLVIQGANDPRVPFSEADQIAKAVEANGVPVWYLLAKDEGHVFTKGMNIDYQLQVSVTFMKRFLLGSSAYASTMSRSGKPLASSQPPIRR